MVKKKTKKTETNLNIFLSPNSTNFDLTRMMDQISKTHHFDF